MNLRANNQIKLYGFEKTFKELVKLYHVSKFPNKILFTGLKGIGKCTLAYHLINYILSENEEKKYDLSNFEINTSNRSYLLTQNGSNPNLNLIDILPEKKNIDIQQIRNLIKLMNKSSFNNKPRFILIDNIEFLNTNSINSLLKFLEEPNNGVYFILINSNKKILPTLKSRCLNFKFFLSNNISLEIANKLTNIDISNQINNELLNYYISPGNIYKLFKFSEIYKLDLKNLSLKELLKKIIKENIYKKNDMPKSLFYELIEFFLMKKPSLIYSDLTNYYLNRINEIKKYNLDEESFFIEFENKLLNG
tara:strand:- start:28 stop:948 length:921 start_codon:yes stop_codon:yes gene_type:complete